jgi:hypothetical protein
VTSQKIKGRVAVFNFDGLQLITESVRGGNNEIIEAIGDAKEAIYAFSGIVGHPNRSPRTTYKRKKEAPKSLFSPAIASRLE